MDYPAIIYGASKAAVSTLTVQYAQDKALRDQLEQLRALSKIGDEISMLRVLDISICDGQGIAPM